VPELLADEIVKQRFRTAVQPGGKERRDRLMDCGLGGSGRRHEVRLQLFERQGVFPFHSREFRQDLPGWLRRTTRSLVVKCGTVVLHLDRKLYQTID
jgi:hypothetical protein